MSARARQSAVRLAVGVFLICSVFLFVANVAGQSSQKVDTSAIGPRVGQRVPDFSGTDQHGQQHTLASSMGAKGAMLVFFRSADW
jgi:cytochrome oxidase Cu insertion factor (SCO1/SenC/PrrC family)